MRSIDSIYPNLISRIFPFVDVDHFPLAITVAIPISYKSHPDTPQARKTTLRSWPFELYPLARYGEYGVGAVNVTLEVGQMLIYEGHSMIHGRPTPLLADHAAFMYVHYRPSDFHKTNAHSDPGLTSFLGTAADASGRHLYVARKVSPSDSEGGISADPDNWDANPKPFPLARPVSDVKQYMDFVYTYDKQPLSLAEHELYKMKDAQSLLSIQQLWKNSYGNIGEAEVLGLMSAQNRAGENKHHMHEL